MFERLRTILIKEFLQVLRDPRMRTVIILSPLIQVLIFGYAANTDIQNIPTAIYDLDNTKESRLVIRAFEFSRYFRLKYYINDDREADSLINRSQASVILRFNRGFGRDLQGNKSARLQVIVDGTDSNTASVVIGYASAIIDNFAKETLKDRQRIYLNKDIKYPTVDLRDRAWFNDNLESKNYYVPGVMATVVTVVALLLTAMAIVREKEIGTMEQLIVSPIRPFELILGKMIPFAVIALVDVTMITMLGIFWFHIPVRGSLFLLFVTTVLYLLTALGVGLFISTVSGTQQEAVMSTFLIFFPVSLLSGFMFPIMNMPKIVQYLTLLNPLRYFLVVIRSIFLKGVGLHVLWDEVVALLIIGVTVFTASSLWFRKKME